MNAKKPCKHKDFGTYWRVGVDGFEACAGIVCGGKCGRHFSTSIVRRALIAFEKAKKEKKK
jgi:hypothetical protein